MCYESALHVSRKLPAQIWVSDDFFFPLIVSMWVLVSTALGGVLHPLGGTTSLPC